jgi:hypothetical protein
VPATASVVQLKALVYATQPKIHVQHQRLSFGDRVLEDGTSLTDYNMSHDSTVLLRYGPKFPFTLRALPIYHQQPILSCQMMKLNALAVSQQCLGEPKRNETPFSPVRSYVSNAQVLPPLALMRLHVVASVRNVYPLYDCNLQLLYCSHRALQMWLIMFTLTCCRCLLKTKKISHLLWSCSRHLTSMTCRASKLL